MNTTVEPVDIAIMDALGPIITFYKCSNFAKRTVYMKKALFGTIGIPVWQYL